MEDSLSEEGNLYLPHEERQRLHRAYNDYMADMLARIEGLQEQIYEATKPPAIIRLVED